MTTVYTTNKWATVASGDMSWMDSSYYSYLAANGWGIWIDGGEWSGSSGNVISWIQSTLEPVMSAANGYGIPIRIDAKDFANNYEGSGAYDQIFAYYTNNWVSGPKGNNLKQYWFEGAGADALQEMYTKKGAGIQMVWAWNQSWYSAPSQLAPYMPYCDITDCEMWWVDDGPATPAYITYLKTNFPTKPIGLDTQPCGSWADQFHLWGQVWDGSDSQPTYATQETRCSTACNTVMTALGRKFDSLTAEMAGDSGDLSQAAHTAPNGTVYPQGGWTEVQIRTNYMDWYDAQSWVSSGTIATQLTEVAPTNVAINVPFNITGTLTTVIGSAAIPGQTVQLQKKSGLFGPWSNVTGATAVTNSSGVYTISVTETATGTDTYRVTYAGGTV